MNLQLIEAITTSYLLCSSPIRISRNTWGPSTPAGTEGASAISKLSTIPHYSQVHTIDSESTNVFKISLGSWPSPLTVNATQPVYTIKWSYLSACLSLKSPFFLMVKLYTRWIHNKATVTCRYLSSTQQMFRSCENITHRTHRSSNGFHRVSCCWLYSLQQTPSFESFVSENNSPHQGIWASHLIRKQQLWLRAKILKCHQAGYHTLQANRCLFQCRFFPRTLAVWISCGAQGWTPQRPWFGQPGQGCRRIPSRPRATSWLLLDSK